MKKNKSTNEHDLSEKLLDLMLLHSVDESNSYLKFIDAKTKFLISQLDSEYENEPMKLFKKTHKKWEEKIEELNSELSECYKKMEQEFQEIEKVNSIINKPKQKKEPSN